MAQTGFDPSWIWNIKKPPTRRLFYWWRAWRAIDSALFRVIPLVTAARARHTGIPITTMFHVKQKETETT